MMCRDSRYCASRPGTNVHQPAAKPFSLSTDAIANSRLLDGLAITCLLSPASSRQRPFAITAWAGTTTPIRNTAVSWCRCIPPASPTSGRCRSSISTCTAAASIFSPRSWQRSCRLACSRPGGSSAPRSGLIGLFVTWRLGRRLGGPFAGLIASHPARRLPALLRAHVHERQRRAIRSHEPIALLGIVRAFQEYPRATPATITLCGIGVGLAIGSRVMGGFAVIDAVLPLLLVLALRARVSGLKPALQRMGQFPYALIPGVILAYLVMGLVWPWAVVAPLNPFHAVEYFSNFFEKPWRELFDGQLILVPDMPRSYVPTLMALKLPELLLALGIGGTIGASCRIAVATAPLRRQTSGGARRCLPSYSPRCFPFVVTVMARPAMYNGIRHFVFTDCRRLQFLADLPAAWIAQRLHHSARSQR